MPWTARTAIIVSFVLLGCEQPAPPLAEATLIRTLAVRMTQFDRTASLTGEIQARRESNMGFRVGGKVIERLVYVGANVTVAGLRPAAVWRIVAGLGVTYLSRAIRLAVSEAEGRI